MLKYIYRKLRKLKTNISRKFKKIVPVYIPVLQSDLLKDRCTFITGGTRGIGYAMAESFLRSGAKVVITGRSESGVNKAVDSLLENSEFAGRVFGIAMDNADVKSFKDKFAKAVEFCGKIDILVNNAGVIKGGGLGNFDEEGFDECLDVNLKAASFLSEIASNYMIENKIEGNIMNVCSSSSLRPAVTPYTMTKWALRGLTLGMAKKLAPHGIVVNGIAPGPTATEMLVKDGYDGLELETSPSGRYATTEEIANMATVLVSGMGKMIIGDTIYMTGGGRSCYIRRHQVLENCGCLPLLASLEAA